MRRSIVLCCTILLISVIALWAVDTPAKTTGTDKPDQQYYTWLKEGNSKQKQVAAKELGKLKDEFAIPALRNALKDTDKKVREAVIQAIIEIPGKASILALAEATGDSETALRSVAIKGIVKKYIPDTRTGFKQILSSVIDYFKPEEFQMVEPWIQIEPEAAAALTRRLNEKKPVSLDAIDAIHALRVYGAIPDLVKAMRGDSDKIVSILKTLADFKAQNTGEQITPLLLSKDDDIVANASYCIGKIGYTAGISSLINLYNYAANVKYQKYALNGLSLLGAKEAEKLFRVNLTSQDSDFRLLAAEGFARMGDPNATEIVARAFLNEQNSKVKVAMDFALFKLGRKEHMMNLLKAFEIDSSSVQSYIVECGGEGFAEIARYLPNLSNQTKIKLIKIMGYSYNPAAMTHIVPYLNDPDIDVATAAFEAIKRLKKVEAMK
jgi:HEAT repeat protein